MVNGNKPVSALWNRAGSKEEEMRTAFETITNKEGVIYNKDDTTIPQFIKETTGFFGDDKKQKKRRSKKR
jgi:hypothetical protein